ncbi:MAG TPA: hypothetical protein VMR18_00330 [Candidatus Saccharimonadales bacterium]|nr:hypothetical protein [Candidatus Saccharimonadales bacterium]
MPVNTNNSGWAGWGYFGGLLMAVLGIAQGVLGVSELGQKKLFFVFTDKLVSNNFFTTWGWIDLVVGALLLIAGFSALHGSTMAKTIGSFFAGLAVLANLIFLPVYPLWSVLSVAVAVLIMYSLAVRSPSE